MDRRNNGIENINYRTFNAYGDMISTTQDNVYLYQGTYLAALGGKSNGQAMNCSLYVMSLGANNAVTYNKLSEAGHATLSEATYDSSTKMLSFTANISSRYRFFRIG